METAAIMDAKGATVDLGRIDWADLDHNGDVLFAAEGRLLRISPGKAFTEGVAEASHCVADLNAMSFDPIESPAAARRWR